MNRRSRDDETGQFSREYDRETFLKAVQTVDTPTTTAISDSVGCSYDLAYRRLHELEREGKVEKTDVGGSFLWERSD